MPYSVEEIYGIPSFGRYGTLKQSYHEFYRIYGMDEKKMEVRPEKIVTEDSHSGDQFFKAVCDDYRLRCDSVNGKSNIFHYLNTHKDSKMLVIADGAGFWLGKSQDTLFKIFKRRTKSGIFKRNGKITNLITNG